jgi:hypothetical protein
VCWAEHVLFRERVAGWYHRAISEEEGWPHDPLNRGILLALLYVGFPLLMIGAFVSLATGWDRNFPIWLSFPLVAYGFVIGWAVFDEWRSRRRTWSENGHGWIWQMAQQFGPRRKVNQAVLLIVALSHIAGATLVYIDRFTARDLERAGATRAIEALVIVAVDM